MAGDAHLQVTEFDLDFGQIGPSFRIPREIADELLVNIRFLCRHIETFFLCRAVVYSRAAMRLQRQRIAERAEAADHPYGDRRDHRLRRNASRA